MPILSAVSLSEKARSLQKNISVRVLKIIVTGRIQTGSYTNRDGQKVYTTDVVVEDQEFAESKAAASESGVMRQSAPSPMAASPMPSPAQASVSRWIYEYSGRN